MGNLNKQDKLNKQKASQVPRWLWVDGEKWYLSSEKTAEFFGVSNRTLLNWDNASGGTLKKDTGWWDVQAIVRWQLDHEKSDAARKLKSEADLKTEQATKARIENEESKGKLIPKADVENEWARRIVELKNSLQALGRKIAGRISDPDTRIEVEKLISDEVYEMLSQYSREGVYTPNKPVKAKKPAAKKKQTTARKKVKK